MFVKKYAFALLLFLFILITGGGVFAQERLPGLTVKNLNGKIILSWLNYYKDKPIQNILIQRSYDSLKNFTTIGTVINPMNTENGYPDVNPPYPKMYYRLSVIFEGGQYIIGPSSRPFKEVLPLEEFDVTYIPEYILEKENERRKAEKANLQIIIADPGKVNVQKNDSTVSLIKKIKPTGIDSLTLITPKRVIETSYPSNRIYTSKYNTVVIQITDAAAKKYTVKVFDDNEKLVMDLKHITEDYLIIEKSNFMKSGWYRFEIYENGILFEKNKFFVGKDKQK